MLYHRLKISSREYRAGDSLFVYSRENVSVHFTYDILRKALIKAATTNGMIHMRIHEIKHGILQDI